LRRDRLTRAAWVHHAAMTAACPVILAPPVIVVGHRFPILVQPHGSHDPLRSSAILLVPLQFRVTRSYWKIWRNRIAASYDANRRNTREALVPPNPKEFDRIVLISRFTGLCGTRSIGVSTEGLSRLMVGGATWSRMASMEKIASTAPAAP